MISTYVIPVVWTLLALLLAALARRGVKGGGLAAFGMALVLVSFAPFLHYGWCRDFAKSGDIVPILALYGCSATLCVVGLFSTLIGAFKYEKGTPVAKRWPLLVTLLATFAFILNFLIGAVVCAVGFSDNKIPDGYQAETQSRHFKSKKFNFSFDIPDGWSLLLPAKLNPDAEFAIGKGFPQIYMIVIAEAPGAGNTLDSEDLAQKAQDNLGSKSQNISIGPPHPSSINGLDGVRFDATATVNGIRMAYQLFCVSRNGFMYQLMVWTDAKHKKLLETTAPGLFKSFKQLDSNLLSPPPGGKFVSERQSEELGYSIKLPPEGEWATWGTEDAKKNPDSDFGAKHLPSDTVIFVDPFVLDGEKIPFDSVAKALFKNALGLDYMALKFDRREPLDKNGFKGLRFYFRSKDDDGDNLAYVADILVRGGDRAFMVCAGRYFDDAPDRKRLEKIAERALATFTPATEALWDGTDILPPGLRKSHADLFNQVGIFFYDADDWRTALRYFLKAWKINPDKQTILTNALATLNKLNRPKRALALIYSVKNKKIATSSDVEAWKAWFLYKTDAFKDAARVYEKLFQKEYRDDADFNAYVESLAMLKRWRDIRKAAERYDSSSGDSFDVVLDAAVTLMDNTQPQEALALINSLKKNRAFNPDLAYKEMRALRDLEKYKELLSLCDKMSERKINSAALCFYRGEALDGLGDKAAALKAYEKALKMAPNNKTIISRIKRLRKNAVNNDNANKKE